ncbi:hypothetical protein CLOL250_02324 [Clostridium sp. L2-50]|nr:hypothetical protein CLOL250_02324 [Clostridium sp. L2-50]
MIILRSGKGRAIRFRNLHNFEWIRKMNDSESRESIGGKLK